MKVRTNLMLDPALWKFAQDYGKPDDRSGSYVVNNLLKELKKSEEKSVKSIKKSTEIAAPKFSFKSELLALGVNEVTLSDWLEVRRKKKASNTKTALKALLTEITKSGLMVNDAIEFAASRSWSGFKANWYFNEQPNDQIKQCSDTTTKNIKNLEGDW